MITTLVGDFTLRGGKQKPTSSMNISNGKDGIVRTYMRYGNSGWRLMLPMNFPAVYGKSS